jgi:signal peptidase I
MKCPSCGLENPPTAQICDCGYIFASSVPPVERKKKRNPFLAAIATLGACGLGQLYNGKPWKAASAYILWLFVSWLAIISPLSAGLRWLVAAASLTVALILIVIADAIRDAHRIKAMSLRPYNRWYIYLAIVIVQLLIVITLGEHLLPLPRAYKIPTNSMSPTLITGDRLIVDMKAYEKNLPARRDLIVFKYPNDESVPYIKRVIGLPEEKLEIKARTVYINDQPLEESYKQHIDPASANEYFGPYAIPQGKYFVLGDSRDNSQDSRFWGFVDQSAILGKAKYIYWSKNWSRIGQNLK